MFFKSGDPHPYCKNACESHTMCGEVEVPEEHLEVCRVCNAFGQNCKIRGPPTPAGPGIVDADFVFYISAMETERCQKGMTVAYAAHCQQESALDRYYLNKYRTFPLQSYDKIRSDDTPIIACHLFCLRLSDFF